MASLITGKCQDINQERMRQGDGGSGRGGGRAARLEPSIIEIKETRYCGHDDIKCFFLHEIPFSLNQPLKSGDGWYIGILKYKINLGLHRHSFKIKHKLCIVSGFPYQ
jgi:hypothetical protein